jgi:hypothetical protein
MSSVDEVSPDESADKALVLLLLELVSVSLFFKFGLYFSLALPGAIVSGAKSVCVLGTHSDSSSYTPFACPPL